MLWDHAGPIPRRHSGAGQADVPGCCRDLFCLLRLSEIVLAEPARPLALRAMIDEVMRLASVKRASLAVVEDGAGTMRYLAHRGFPDRVPHRSFSAPLAKCSTEALVQRRMVQVPNDGSGAGAGLTVPILAGERALGVLGVNLAVELPIDAWDEELFWAIADLLALVLLGRDTGPIVASTELRLTRRQSDVVFELVEHGASNEQIAEALSLSARTVKIHLQAAYRLLGVRTRSEAIRLVLTRHAEWLSRERERRHGRSTP